MKIGFLGNANNYPFMLARALRRAGHEVLFVLNQRSLLNRPEHRYDDLTPADAAWILDAGELEGTERFQFLPKSPLRDRIIDRLSACDAVVFNHAALSLANLVGRPHIALLTGTDVQDLADPRYVRQADGFPTVTRTWLEDAIARQRAGIATAVAVSVFFRGLVPRHDATLDGLGLGPDRRFFCWMTDPQYIRATPPPGNDVVRIFNLARLTWKRVGEGEFTEDHKASDVMILGLGEFCRRHPDVGLDVRLVEKGSQVAEAKELVQSCGLSSRVTWLKEMTQRDVLEEYAQADIVFDQMGLSLVAMGGLDAMALGRPLIANARPDVLRHYVPDPPVCQAATADEVVAQLERLVLNRAERERIGRESRAYVERHCSADAAAVACVERIEAVVTNPRRYSQWSKEMMDATRRLAAENEARWAEVENRLLQREHGIVADENRLADVRERESAVLKRENLLARREELSSGHETRLAEREAQVAAAQASVDEQRAEVNRYFREYEALRVVRWQRALKSWKGKLTGNSGQK